jgi:hypothetical protein
MGLSWLVEVAIAIGALFYKLNQLWSADGTWQPNCVCITDDGENSIEYWANHSRGRVYVEKVLMRRTYYI